MKNLSLLVVVFMLWVGVMAFAQHGHGGGMGNPGMGNAGSIGGGMGHGNEAGMPHGNDSGMGHGSTGQGGHDMSGQRPLSQAQMSGGAMRMLERKYPGMTASQLEALYKSSGAKNFGQFVSAMVVSKNLGLDYNKVLAGMQNASLGKTLQTMGVSKSDAKSAIKKAHEEIADSDKNESKES